MTGARAECRRDRQCALEVAAEAQFLGQPHRTVDLYRAFTDDPHGVADLDARGADRLRTVGPVLIASTNRDPGELRRLHPRKLHLSCTGAPRLKSAPRRP